MAVPSRYACITNAAALAKSASDALSDMRYEAAGAAANLGLLWLRLADVQGEQSDDAFRYIPGDEEIA